jgi:hypothetical protein
MPKISWITSTTVAVLYSDPLAVARGFFECGFGPVLGEGEGRGEQRAKNK